ncbi:amidase, partial [Ralstonia pseudosolanacearum]|uniref:amidase n=1 Tax=Ralstonia pseudosolanacearum TaxID=1310165 RepID=UPI0018D0F4C6
VPSLLAGLPVSIKDLFDLAGQVTAAGSRALAHQSAATSDATAVARLRAAGAVLLGRTNMSEFAFSGLGLNPHYGTPRTPADGTRAAGGSTSGGAVTVAGGMAVAALGTDTGGSIRIPAAFCALTGFKPTARRVPMAGGVPLSTSLDSGGPLANSVDCCAIVDAVLSGQALDTDAVPLAGLRLGLTRDYVAADLDDTVATAFARAVARLERAGAHIVRFEFPELLQLPEINGGGGLPAAEAWAWHRPHLARAEAQYDRRVAARIRRGEQMSAAAYLDVMAARVRMIAAARKRLGNLDAWLMPTVAVVPPEVAPLEADDARFFHTNARVLRNPSAINFLDGCALTLPIHAAGELPVGLSLCGLADDDARILRVGRAVETALR